MIDTHTDNIYNIILSIAVGIVFVLFIDQILVRPVVITAERE